MASPKDIVLSANIVIRHHGNAAEEYAAKKLWEFKHQKDDKAVAAWNAIILAIKELRNTKPPMRLN